MTQSSRFLLLVCLLLLQPLAPARADHNPQSNIADPEDTSLPIAESRAQNAVEKTIELALDNLPEKTLHALTGLGAVGPEGTSASQIEGLQLFGFDTYMKDSQKEPTIVWDFGTHLDSRLVAMRGDLFIEGFYRNMEFHQGGSHRPQIPYLRWDGVNGKYDLVKSGGENVLLENLLALGGVYDEKSGLVYLYRGTMQAEVDKMKPLRELTKNPATNGKALEQANALAAKLKDGSFFSNAKDAAERFASEANPGPGAVLIAAIPKDKLAALVKSKDIYIGYENDYFELSFLSGKALLLLAESMQN